MDKIEYCSKRDTNCFRNLSLLSVISQWFQENDIYLDFNLAQVICFTVLSLIAWILIKIFFRIIKSMLKPLLIIFGLLIIIYTKQFSYSKDPAEFVENVCLNTLNIITKFFEIVYKIIFGEHHQVVA